MKILFTGASSFTGFWFVKRLAEAGHEVHATFRGSGPDAYADVRCHRVREVLKYCRPIWACPFGSETFLSSIVSEGTWDLLCHHAAEVRDYRSSDFNVTAALETNTLNMRAALILLQQRGLRAVLATGTSFEAGEGCGTAPLEAILPYGLSKTLTFQVTQFWCHELGLQLRKFVIPNPFGPFEEQRFTSYLAKTWLEGKPAHVKTPLYIRDNIHVSLLAAAYAVFATSLTSTPRRPTLHPSGYVESQGAFATRFATAMRDRLGCDCTLVLETQQVFTEPAVRINTDALDTASFGWTESGAWDELAEFYLRTCR